MKKRYWFIIIVSVVAFINALYLSMQAYAYRIAAQDGSSFCDFSSGVSCSAVLQSPYSHVFGIPFPWIALGVYPVLFAIALIGLRRMSVGPARALAVLSFLGMMFNFFIMYRELMFIHAFCVLCFLCTLIIISIFVASRGIISRKEQTQQVLGV